MLLQFISEQVPMYSGCGSSEFPACGMIALESVKFSYLTIVTAAVCFHIQNNHCDQLLPRFQTIDCFDDFIKFINSVMH
jgi:hypothetical protein